MARRTWWHRLLDRQWLQGNPILHVAVLANRPWLFDWLVRLGADPAKRDDQGMSIMHAAVFHPSLAVAEPFLKRALKAGIDINDRDKDNYTALHFAVFYDRSETVAWLLDHGANMRARTCIGTTALRHAVRWRRVMATRKLLEAGAFVDERDVDGETLLLEANVNPNLAQVLTEFGADVQARDHGGQNLLHLAGGRADPEMVRWALAQGVDRTATNGVGHTPLQAVQCEVYTLFGGMDGLRDAFAEPSCKKRPMLTGDTAGNWSLVLGMLGHPRFSDVGEA